jgi:hypothetical protein
MKIFGHHSFDEFRLLFNKTQFPISSILVASGMTPSKKANPSFRQYFFRKSGAKFELEDWSVFFLPLIEANAEGWSARYVDFVAFLDLLYFYFMSVQIWGLTYIEHLQLTGANFIVSGRLMGYPTPALNLWRHCSIVCLQASDRVVL